MKGVAHFDKSAENYRLTLQFPSNYRAFKRFLVHCFDFSYSSKFTARYFPQAMAKERVNIYYLFYSLCEQLSFL